jgi:hypothetical protein
LPSPFGSNTIAAAPISHLRILIGTSPTANCCQASPISTKVRAVQIVLLF